MDEPLNLYWNDSHVATVEEAAWEDFPWVSGRFVAVAVTPELRQALEWLAAIADADELEDPPFDSALLDGWRLGSPGGQTREVSPPIVDFESGTVTWR